MRECKECLHDRPAHQCTNATTLPPPCGTEPPPPNVHECNCAAHNLRSFTLHTDGHSSSPLDCKRESSMSNVFFPLVVAFVGFSFQYYLGIWLLRIRQQRQPGPQIFASWNCPQVVPICAALRFQNARSLRQQFYETRLLVT